MLEGLEVTVVSLLKLRNENWTFRIDSEFLKKEYIKNIDKIKSTKSGYLKLNEAIIHMTGGATPLGAEYSESGIPFLRVQNIMQNYFSLNDVVYISKKQSNEIKRSVLKFKDVLLTITGVSYGKSATVTKKIEGSNINQHSVKITLNDNVNPYFLSTFLNCSFGKLQSDKNVVGVTRPALDYEVIKNFNIPIVSRNFQNQIESIILNSEVINHHAETKYSQAENLLLETLGLNNFEPTTEAVNIKSFTESFLNTGRLDAEHYQIKYDILEKYFDAFDRKRIGDFIIHPVVSGTTPKAGGDDYTGSESGIPFIRAVDLHNGEVLTSNFIYIKHNIHNGILKRTHLKEGDVLFSIAGTVGRCALFNHKFEANINQAVSILRFDDAFIKRLYLVVFFNSEIGKEFVSKYSRQGVQTNLNLSEVSNLRIPIIDYSIQEKIASLVSESFTLKKQSEQLLEIAKRAVEIAIEENEEAAMHYIQQNN